MSIINLKQLTVCLLLLSFPLEANAGKSCTRPPEYDQSIANTYDSRTTLWSKTVLFSDQNIEIAQCKKSFTKKTSVPGNFNSVFYNCEDITLVKTWGYRPCTVLEKKALSDNIVNNIFCSQGRDTVETDSVWGIKDRDNQTFRAYARTELEEECTMQQKVSTLIYTISIENTSQRLFLKISTAEPFVQPKKPRL